MLIRGLSKRLDDLRLVTVDCNIFLFTVSPDLSEPNNSMLDKKKLETHGFSSWRLSSLKKRQRRRKCWVDSISDLVSLKFCRNFFNLSG